jgi:eukaryotic-like serine/threonine-protein kinase
VTPDQWQVIKRVLAGALERAPEERPAYLDLACTDGGVRREVESLLEANGHSGATESIAPLLGGQETLKTGGRLGHYEIVARIGAGGMGEVYRAHDTKLKRDVAVKVLPPAFAKDPERLARFAREARLLAALNHPGIASIYGLEDSGDTHALVMELVEGPTLADRIGQGAIPLEEALSIAKLICDALEYAHERGIVHRDLKPANIKISGDDSVKVLDFGLAKALQGEASGADIANSPTISQMATEAGVLLGTAAYMSPEQAKAKAVDRRADIWAFGCVLYEMVTGQRAFGGESVTETLAAVLNNEPDWSRLPGGTPMRVRLLLQRCLRKDPKQRLRDIGDARIALEEVLTGAPDPSLADIPGPIANRRLRTLPWALASAASMAALALAFILIATVSAPPASGPLIWKQLTFSTEHKKGPIITDGTRLYFQSQDGPVEMSVNGGPIAPLRASISGMQMMDISPDGSQLLALQRDLNDETSRGSLWSVPVLGGYPRMLGSQTARGAEWSADGRLIVYADLTSVFVGDANGANLRKVWDAPGEVSEPHFSPDSRQICVTVVEGTKPAKVWQLNTDGGSPHPLDLNWPADAEQRDGQWTPDGKHFIFLSPRSGQVHIYDVYEVIRPPWFAFWKKTYAVRLTEGQINVLGVTPSRDGAGLFTVGETAQGAMQAWDPAQKRFVPFLGGLAASEFVISPDKKWMVYVDYPQHHLWRSRLDGSERFQLTDIYSIMPRWSPDSKKIVFSDWSQIYMVSADGGTPESLIPNPNEEVWPAWSPDGKSIAFNDYPIPGQFIGIKLLDLATRKISVMPGSEGFYMPTWSPDGRYMVAWGQNPTRLMLYSARDRSWKVLRVFTSGFLWAWSNDSRFLYLQNNADAGQEQVRGFDRLTVPDGAWSHVDSNDTGSVIGSAAQGVFLSVTADGQPAMMIDTSMDQIYSANWK